MPRNTKRNVTPSTGNNSVLRAVKILELFTRENPTSFKRIVEELGGISHATCSRLLETLIEAEYLEKEGRQYRLIKSISPPLTQQLGGQFDGLRNEDKVRAILRRITIETGLSSGIFRLIGKNTMKVEYQNYLPGHLGFREESTEVPLSPFHGVSLAFLANAERTLLDHVYNVGRMIRHNRYPSYQEFLDNLAKVRRNKYAVENEDENANVARIAMPLTAAGDHIPSRVIGVIGYADIINNIVSVIDVLEHAAHEITLLQVK